MQMNLNLEGNKNKLAIKKYKIKQIRKKVLTRTWKTIIKIFSKKELNNRNYTKKIQKNRRKHKLKSKRKIVKKVKRVKKLRKNKNNHQRKIMLKDIIQINKF